MRICITGTPGSGKTYFAIRLAKKLKIEYFDLNSFIKKNKLYDHYDRSLRTYIIDIPKIMPYILKEISNRDLVIDSHLSHFIPPKYIDLCIVKMIDLNELKKRLEKRGYSKGKIRDNLDSEIFEVCKTEAQELGHRLYIIKDNQIRTHFYAIKNILNL